MPNLSAPGRGIVTIRLNRYRKQNKFLNVKYFNMKARTFAALMATSLALVMISCTKNPVTNDDYLKFSKAHVHITNKTGARGAVMVESNIAWKLAFETPAPNWATLDKFSGSGSDSLVVTATMDNTTGGYKFATVIATPVNNSNIMPVRLTIVQYDSTFKTNN
jgi:hypothetical protein